MQVRWPAEPTNLLLFSSVARSLHLLCSPIPLPLNPLPRAPSLSLSLPFSLSPTRLGWNGEPSFLSPHCVSQGCCHFCSPIVRIHQRIHSFRSHCLVDCPRLRSSLSLSLLLLSSFSLACFSILILLDSSGPALCSTLTMPVLVKGGEERRPTRNKLRRACNLYFFSFFSSFRRAPILGFLPIPGFSDFQCFPRAFQRVMWVTDRGGMLADTTSC